MVSPDVSPHTFSSTSSSLLGRVKNNESAAWDRLAQLYGPLIYRWARQLGLQPSDAADVVQEVFRSVFRYIGDFRHASTHDTFRGWLWTITRNHSRVHFRKLALRAHAEGGTDAHRRMEQVPELVDSEVEPAGFDAKTSLTHRALQLVRNDFEPHTWQAFWRLTIDGHSTGEIATDLGISTGAVRQAKYRVLARLREELGKF